MVQCAVEGCSSRSDTQSTSCLMENSIHFHRVPLAPGIRKRWMQAINKLEIKNSTRVCSLHFKKENYYLTKQGFYKLIGSSVPELKLATKLKLFIPIKNSKKDSGLKNINDKAPGPSNIKAKYHTKDSTEDVEMSNVEHLDKNIKKINYRDQSQQTSPVKITPENGTTTNVTESSNTRSTEDVKDDIMEISEDLMSNISIPNSEATTTNNVLESSTTKPVIKKVKAETQLEKYLLKEVRRLREIVKKRMEAIDCLLDQNRRLLERNTFLEKSLIDNQIAKDEEEN